MFLGLRDDVHAALVNDDLVLLDITADRYVCLSGAGAVANLSAGRDQLVTDNHDLAGRLDEAGLLRVDACDREPRTAPPPKATRTAFLSDIPPAALRDLAPASAALIDTVLHYHRRPFAEIVRQGRYARRAPPQITEPLQLVVTRFHAWIPYAPVSAQCLLRSFMLLRLLRRRGLDALWVFGVQTWPFSAHCWLQVEDMVLDDPAERIAAYTPIMVV